LLSAKL